jgi:hypothetical protein
MQKSQAMNPAFESMVYLAVFVSSINYDDAARLDAAFDLQAARYRLVVVAWFIGWLRRGRWGRFHVVNHDHTRLNTALNIQAAYDCLVVVASALPLFTAATSLDVGFNLQPARYRLIVVRLIPNPATASLHVRFDSHTLLLLFNVIERRCQLPGFEAG